MWAIAGQAWLLNTPDQSCLDLLENNKTRLPTLELELGPINVEDFLINLHLGAEDGPIIGVEDSLSDVLPGAEKTVFAILQVKLFHIVESSTRNPPMLVLPKADDSTQNTRLKESCHRTTADQPLRIRVITPKLAHSAATDETAAPLDELIELKGTLRDLEDIVQRHLGIRKNHRHSPELECNCTFAIQIDD